MTSLPDHASDYIGAGLRDTDQAQALPPNGRGVIIDIVAVDEIRGAPPVCQDRAGCFVFRRKRGLSSGHD
jgi:hypothetical protein